MNSELIHRNTTDNIVIDHGSYTCKYGYAGRSTPIGTINACGIIKNSIIQNFDKMCEIWDIIIYEKLKIDPKHTKIMISLANSSDTTYYNKIRHIMTHKYMFNHVQLYNQQLLSLYSVGKNTGLVVDIGHEITRIVPIYDSCVIEYGIIYSNLTGKLIDEYLKYISVCDTNFNKIKKNIIKSNNSSMLYEVLFNPSLIHHDTQNLTEIVLKSINMCPIDLRIPISKNIILVGGTSSIPGLCKELKKNIGLRHDVKIFGPKNRNIASWIGGSVLMCLPNTK
jgi:actin, other eukaryote